MYIKIRERVIEAVMIILTITLLLGVMRPETARASVIQIEDGNYHVNVSLWHAMNDEASLGNAALKPQGRLCVQGDEAYIYLAFTAMSFAGMEGYLMQIDFMDNILFNAYGYPESYTLQTADVCSAYSVIDAYNSADSDDEYCAGRSYPEIVKAPIVLGQEYSYVHVYVPVMGSLGFGDQICRLKVDFNNLTLMTEAESQAWDKQDDSEEPASTVTVTADKTQLKKKIANANAKLKKTEEYTEASLKELKQAVEKAVLVYENSSALQTAVDKQVTALQTAIDNLVKKPEEQLDKDNLADGKYSLRADIWHAVADQESMGNPAVNKPSLLTVADGIYTMEVSTRPMTVGTITTCLHSLQIKQENGNYVYADITANNNDGGLPSVFCFTLPSKEEYIDIMIDPQIEIMGSKPLSARLKIQWDTLIKVSDDTKVEENNTPVDGGSSAEDSTASGQSSLQSGQKAANTSSSGTQASSQANTVSSNKKGADSSKSSAAAATESELQIPIEEKAADEQQNPGQEMRKKIFYAITWISVGMSFVYIIIIFLSVMKVRKGKTVTYEEYSKA